MNTDPRKLTPTTPWGCYIIRERVRKATQLTCSPWSRINLFSGSDRTCYGAQWTSLMDPYPPIQSNAADAR
jgi:hypothetical protein